MPDPSAVCTLPDGSTINLASATADQAKSCVVSVGAAFSMEEEDPASAAPAPVPPLASPRLVPRISTMEPTAAPAQEAAQAPEAAPADTKVEAPAPAQELTAGTEVPSDAPAAPTAGEIGDLIASNGGGAVGIIAAVIAVVGGTAGFKLWTKISEQKHEQSMKKLDIEQANAGLAGAQPPPCQAAHQTLVVDIKALSASVKTLDSRLDKVEKKSSGFDPSVDVNDLEERVEVIEKSLRKKARTGGGE